MGQMISKVATLAGYFMKDLSLGQVKSPHHSDQVFQRSQVSGVALCMLFVCQ